MGEWRKRKETPEWRRVKNEVKRRDGYKCVRCGRYQLDRKGLHVHHIVAVMDGGQDDPDNCITLCSPCHAEWHTCEQMMNVAFPIWLHDIPPYSVLIAPYISGKLMEAAGELSLSEYVDISRRVEAVCKSLRLNGNNRPDS